MVFLYTPPALLNIVLSGGKLLGMPVSPFLREGTVRISYGLPILSLAAAPLALWLTRRRVPASVQRESRSIVLFAALFFLGIFPSAIWSHLAFVAGPASLALAIVCDRVQTARPVGTARWLESALAVGLSAAALATAAGTARATAARFPRPLSLPRASLFVTPSAEKLYHGSLRFIDDCAPPGASIFVVPDIPILYFLADRTNPTPYDVTIPGNVDEHVILERLDADRTRCVVYNPRMYPEFPSFPRLFPRLHRYRRTRYDRAVVIAAGGTEWHGLVRKEAAPPE